MTCSNLIKQPHIAIAYNASHAYQTRSASHNHSRPPFPPLLGQESCHGLDKCISLLQMRAMTTLGKPDPLDLLDLLEIWLHGDVLRLIESAVYKQYRDGDFV